MVENRSNWRSKRTERLMLLGYGLVVAASVLGLSSLWHRHYATTQLVLEKQVDDVAAKLNDLISATANHITVMRFSAEARIEDLDTSSPPASMLYTWLSPSQHFKGYCLEDKLPIEERPANAGLSGAGAVPSPGTPIAHELEMALSLSPQFVAVSRNIPNMAWAYYTSARGFMALYPWTSCKDFHFDPEQLTHEFFTLGQPGVNPQRAPFWTQAYLDLAGKGLMATAGAPIYDGRGQFLGTVAIDLTLDVLSEYMRDPDLSIGAAMVINDHGQLLAHPNRIKPEDKAILSVSEIATDYGLDDGQILLGLPDREFKSLQGVLFYSSKLEGAPWSLVFLVDRNAVALSVLGDMRVEFIGFLLLVLLLIAFEVGRRSRAQLQHHVADLENAKRELESQGEALKKLSIDLAKARDEANQASRAKSIMLANVSHDLRTPLNAILGFSEVMIQGLFGPLGSEKYAGYAKDIHSSGTHLLEIINDVLDLSKMEAGRYKMQEQVCELSDLVADCRQLVDIQANRAGVELATSLPQNLPAIRVDPRAIKQVLINLLSNSVKFSRKGGIVELKAAQLAPGGLQIEVTDNGDGIAPADMPHLFTPFARGATADKANTEGTGLGLAIVKSLIEMHGGAVAIRSQLHHGTTVTVTLPADRMVERPA